MTRRIRKLTVFGEDLDYLLSKAGKFTLPEYADECGVNYKYILQLRTIPERRPGKLYVDLLKPFAGLHTINLIDSQQLSLRHRGKPLSFTECRELFPDLPEEELVESVKQANEVKDLKDFQLNSAKADDSITTIGISRPKKIRQLYPHVFVGRENELNELKLSFDNAVANHGSLVMVVGEPGIGKTTICGQLMDYVHEREGISLIGHCSEPGSLSLPYLALIEVLSSYMLICDDKDLKDEIGFGSSDIARIVPEIAERLNITIPPVKNVDEERYRLFQSVTQFLGNIAAKQPLLIVLEDLHNADYGTLEMLKHIARNLGGRRLLIVGTYRDIEVDRTHHLSATLAELRRLPDFERIFLRGLDVTEIEHMLSNIVGHHIPAGLNEAVYIQTEGNPLFVEEVAYYLVEEGLSTEESEFKQTARDMNIEMKVPEGLRDVLGKRLSALSQNCKNILSLASVIGREFRLDVLQKITDLSEVEVLEAIEEAQNSAILNEGHIAGTAVTYRFSHALFRQTLYEEMIAPRRIRLHQQVAKALEEIYAKGLKEHAAELTEHFSQSTDPSDLEKAVWYGQMAAKRATGVFAYGEAARLIQQALRIQEILEPGDMTKWCNLLLSICEKLLLAGEPRHILENEAPEAFSLAESIGDKESAASACIMAIWALVWETAGIFRGTAEEIQWAERINRYAEPDTLARVWADIISGTLNYMKGRATLDMTLVTKGVSLLTRAVDTARRIDDVEALWVATFYYIYFTSALKYSEERVRLAEEVVNRSPTGVSLFSHSTGLVFSGYPFLEVGKRDRAEEVWREFLDIAKRTQQAFLLVNAAQVEGQLAFLDGRLDEAVEIIHKLQARSSELSLANTISSIAYCILPRPLFHLGRAEQALQLVKSVSPFIWNVAVCLAYMGQEKEAVESLERGMTDYPMAGSDQDESTVFSAICFLEAAVLLNHKRIAELLLERLKSTKACTTGMWWLTCIPRHLGGAAFLLERYDEAREHYKEAIRVCTEMRFRPELALSRLGLAELLLAHYPDEKAEALEHLDFAIKEFREMKMQPSLERALRKKDISKA